jgi:hypothetical protein
MYRCIFIRISNLTSSSFSFCSHEKPHNKYKIINSCFSGDQIKKNERGRGMWHVWGDRRGSYTVLVRKPEGKSPLARPRRR